MHDGLIPARANERGYRKGRGLPPNLTRQAYPGPGQ